MYWFEDLTVLQYIKELRADEIPWKEILTLLRRDFPNYIFSSSSSLRKRFSEREIGEFMSYDDAYQALCTYIGKTQKPKECSRKSKEHKYLIISDFHIPFHNGCQSKEPGGAVGLPPKIMNRKEGRRIQPE